MKLLVLNGSPRKNGATARILSAIVEGAAQRHEIEWIDVYDLIIKPCRGCLACRPDGECVLPRDDGHRMNGMIRAADVLIVGTPTYWANMSAPLKALFDRNVPVFEYINTGFPRPMQKGKKAIIVTAAASPWPFHLLPSQAGGTVRALRVILRSAGYRIAGVIIAPGIKKVVSIPEALLKKARRMGRRL